MVTEGEVPGIMASTANQGGKGGGSKKPISPKPDKDASGICDTCGQSDNAMGEAEQEGGDLAV